MPVVDIYNMAGEVVGQHELSDAVFGVQPHVPVMHQAMVTQLTNLRQGTVKTKTRGEVAGGGVKPWRQKGTGRARQGSTRAPHWRGGGVVWGPRQRPWTMDLPKKMKRLALKSALSSKVLDGQLILLDDLSLEEPKTKAMVDVLSHLPVEQGRKMLIVLSERNDNVYLSSRNIPGVTLGNTASLNMVEILKHMYLILPVSAAQRIEEVWG